MKQVAVIGIDPSLRNFALVKTMVDLDTQQIVSIERMSLVETTTTKNKQVRKNSDDMERCRKIYKSLQEFIEGAVLVCAEVPVGSQSSRAMVSYAACVAILSTVELPMIQVTPNEVKLAATGDKNATKEDMILWATDKFPEADWFKGKAVGAYGGKNEHLADAVAAIEAGLQTEEFKGYLAMMKLMAE